MCCSLGATFIKTTADTGRPTNLVLEICMGNKTDTALYGAELIRLPGFNCEVFNVLRKGLFPFPLLPLAFRSLHARQKMLEHNAE